MLSVAQHESLLPAAYEGQEMELGVGLQKCPGGDGVGEIEW